MVQSPFPGMDPYLESPDLWPDVHARLMTIFAEQLSPLLSPNYIAELNTQVVIDQIVEEGPFNITAVLPDVVVTQPLDTRDPGMDGMWTASAQAVQTLTLAPPLILTAPVALPTRLVTLHIRRRPDTLVAVIELLSPVNKRPGPGRDEYLEKRMAYLNSHIHFIEIDLLRQWSRLPFGGDVPNTAYLAAIFPNGRRPYCQAWPIGVRDPLPTLPIPLLPPDPPVPLDMGQALRTAYARARYDLRIDYKTPLNPPLASEEAEWAAALLAK